MATGASTCDLAILLIDARKGVLDQTRRHSFIATLLGIRHLVVAVNKMDLRDYQQDVFEQIKQDYLSFAEQLPADLEIKFVPLSALDGDNVASQSTAMGWYHGPTLLEILESVDVVHDAEKQPLRFPVQYVNRPNLISVATRVRYLPALSASGRPSKCYRLAYLRALLAL